MQRRLPKLGFMFRSEGTIRHCLLWRARSHRHDDLRDTTAETYRARALFPPLLLDHADRVASARRESGRLPQPRTPVIMGPDRSLSSGGAMRRPGGRDDVACVARSHRMHCLAFSFQTAAPHSCSLPLVASCGEGWRQRQCLWQPLTPTLPQPSPTRVPQGERERAAAGASSRRFAQSGATSACPRLCEGCLAIPLVIQDYRPLDEARGFFVPSMLFAPFRPRTSHVMGFGSVLPDRTSPKRVQKIQNRCAQSCPHRVERKTARRMQTHQSLLSLRQWLSARPRS